MAAYPARKAASASVELSAEGACARVGSAGSSASKRTTLVTVSFSRFKLWLRIGLELLGHLEFVRRLTRLSQRAVGLPQQCMCHIISRIHRQRLIQVHPRHDRVLPFQ